MAKKTEVAVEVSPPLKADDVINALKAEMNELKWHDEDRVKVLLVVQNALTRIDWK